MEVLRIWVRSLATKREIRRWICQKRRNIQEEVWLKYSEEIASAVTVHPWFLAAGDLCTYVDYNGEAGTRKIIETAFERGKNVWVPKVTGKSMRFYHIGSLEELKPGVHGILEPVPKSDECPGPESGLMIVPGVAFDESCHRIGYGGGYYDRYLAEHPVFHTIALAFEFQIFPEVPYEEYDICPEVLITEERMIPSVGAVC